MQDTQQDPDKHTAAEPQVEQEVENVDPTEQTEEQEVNEEKAEAEPTWEDEVLYVEGKQSCTFECTVGVISL